MVEWFHERYISRAEHQEIVDYYKKLVVQLHRKVSELRAHIDTQVDAAAMDDDRPDKATVPPGPTLPHCYGGNVISFESRRRSRTRTDMNPEQV
jgi:hypothetical protein